MKRIAALLGVTFRPEALVAAAIAGISIAIWCGAIPLGGLFGAGVYVLICQYLASRTTEVLRRERDCIRLVLDRMLPLARSGVAMDQALATSAAGLDFDSARLLQGALQSVSAGQAPESAAKRLTGWPLTGLTFQLFLIHRENGGNPTGFIEAFRRALSMADDLAKKKQIALIQIRWQANIITLFFFLVLLASVAHAGVFFSALLSTEEGKIITSISANLVVWGRVILNLLARTME